MSRSAKAACAWGVSVFGLSFLAMSPLAFSAGLTWHTFLFGPANEHCHGVAADTDGNTYVLGSSDATWGDPIRPFGGGDRDVFVAKLDASGALRWNTFLGGTAYGDPGAIAVDGNGNVYVSGASLDPWGAPVRAFSGGMDGLVAKFDTHGNLLWNSFLGGASYDGACGVAVDAGGNVYASGWSRNAAWGDPVRPFSGGIDAFVAKLDANGSLAWNTFLGAGTTDVGQRLAVDTGGDIRVAGTSFETWGIPVRPISGDLRENVFVAKLDANGSLVWNTFLGGDGRTVIVQGVSAGTSKDGTD